MISQDQCLVKRLIAREDAAWQEFVARYDRLIFARVHATGSEFGMRLQRSAAAEEIVSEVYSLLLDSDMRVLRQFAGRSRLSTWLTVIVRRVTLRQLLRLQQHSDTVAAEDHRISEPENERNAATAENLQQLKQARVQLSRDDQQVLCLFYDHGRSYDEIARELKISGNAVGPKLNRAKQRLRSLLKRPSGG